MVIGGRVSLYAMARTNIRNWRAFDSVLHAPSSKPYLDREPNPSPSPLSHAFSAAASFAFGCLFQKGNRQETRSLQKGLRLLAGLAAWIHGAGWRRNWVIRLFVGGPHIATGRGVLLISRQIPDSLALQTWVAARPRALRENASETTSWRPPNRRRMSGRAEKAVGPDSAMQPVAEM
jgi:hypothetical protein